MPVVHLPYKYLERLSGTDRQTIMDNLPMIGSEVERILDDGVDVEFFPSRVDLYSTEGVARAMRGFLGLEEGEERYVTVPSGISFSVDPALIEIRPYLGSAVIRDIRLDDEMITSLMEIQEALHWVVGRGRAKVAIGIHDLDRVTPPFRYYGAPLTRSFVPLDFSEEMTLARILEMHPKGRDYAHIVSGKPVMPLIEDAGGQVLSFPPIINGELTRVTGQTTNLLLDVTGTDPRAVQTALKVLTTALITAGGRCETVLVDGLMMPDLQPSVRDISVSAANRLIGLDLNGTEMAALLRKMRYGAETTGDDLIEVIVPCYRADIMHDWDIYEDVAIAYGYNRISGTVPQTFSLGKEHPVMTKARIIREIATGLGYVEVMPLTLTSDAIQYRQMQRPEEKTVLRVLHPISEEQTLVRTSILPMLLDLIRFNKMRELPQKIFHTGDIVRVIDGSPLTLRALALASTHPGADFSEAYATADAVLRELDLAYDLRESSDPAFIAGRRADIIVDGTVIGVFGEIHPAVLNGFDLDQPVAAVEIDIIS